jgi:FMN phosphatase YigB (HAD superfamily)
MHVDVILFDWGGTLAQVVRQEEALRRGAELAAALPPGGVNGAALAQLVALVLQAEKEAAADPQLREASMPDLVRRWAGLLGRTADEAWVASAVEAFGSTWIGSLEPLPGAVEAVRALRERGCRMGLVSNCMVPPAYCDRELDRQGFGPLLDFAIFSSGVGYRKPAPAVYARALEAAYPEGPPSDLSRVLFVGDSPAFDVAAPARLGMKTALVTCHRGLWPAADYENAHPDLRVDAVAELPALLGER